MNRPMRKDQCDSDALLKIVITATNWYDESGDYDLEFLKTGRLPK